MNYRDSEASSYDGPSDSPMRVPDKEELARAAKMRHQSSDRGPIEAVLDRCDEATTSLAELAENLHHRLAPILGPDRPDPALGEVRAEGDSSPLAERLGRLADRLDDARSVLLRATRRIEL